MADPLSMVYLFKDLFFQHGVLSDWHFSPVPYFFPDTILVFLLSSLSSNFRIVVLLADAVLLACYYNGIVLVGQLVCGKEHKDLFRLSALLSLFLVVGPLGGQELFNPILVSHFGSNVVVYLAELFFILKLLNQERTRFYIALAFLSLVTSYSDPFFFLIFCCAVFPGLVAVHKSDATLSVKMLKKITLSVFLVGLIGFALNYFNVLRSFVFIEHLGGVKPFYKPLQAIERFKETLEVFYTNNCEIVWGFSVFFLIGIVILTKSILGKKLKDNLDKSSLLVISILTMSMLITVLMLFADPDRFAPSFWGLRHDYPLIVLPVFLGLPILLAVKSNIGVFIQNYYRYFVLGILGSAVLFSPWKSLKEDINYYSPQAQCLDKYIQKGMLTESNGVTEYWDAHTVNLFSKEGIHLVAVNNDITPYNWMATTQDYTNKKFYYVFFKENMDAKDIIAKLGEPNEKLVCENIKNYQIYIYQQGFFIN